MMARRIVSHGAFSVVFGVVYLGFMTNVLLIVGCLPLVVLAFTTDPARSWPLLAIALPLCAPALAAAFTVFRENAVGGTGVIRPFLRGWLAAWRRALPLGAMVASALTVLLVDVRFFSDRSLGVAVIPLLGVLTVLVLSVGVVGLVAVAEVPSARLRDILRASAYLLVRRWYLTIVSLGVLAVQVALFTSLPAIALGLTAAPALYLVWANSRYTLRPVLETELDVVDAAVA